MESISVSNLPLQQELKKKSEADDKISVKLRNLPDIVREKFVVMHKKVFEHKWLKKYGFSGESDRTRAYHVWPGNNVFFFHGRLVCGPDPRGLLLTTTSILLSSWIFAAYTVDDVPNHSGLAMAFSMILTAIVLVNLFLVSAIDPGIIPRSDQTEETGTSSGSRRKRVTINGVELKLRYCRICKIYRPPRTCHCTICDNCVEKFDHHCPWIGQCIALRNYRFYLAFVTSSLIFFLYIFAFSCWGIHQRIRKNGTGFFGIVKNCPETVALVSFSFAATWFLWSLTMFHAFLVSTNQTAYENYKQCYASSQNPFDKGILSNVKEVLFAPLPRSRVDFRAEVITPEET